jgi:hypothetical protein
MRGRTRHDRTLTAKYRCRVRTITTAGRIPDHRLAAHASFQTTSRRRALIAAPSENRHAPCMASA